MTEAGRVGRVGELKVAERLLEVGWNVAFPEVDEGVDLVAFKEGTYRPIQVKRATLRENYAYKIYRKKMRPDTWLVLSLGEDFLVMTYPEWSENMGAKLESPTWQKRGEYNDHIHRDLRGWTQFLDNEFKRLDEAGDEDIRVVREE